MQNVLCKKAGIFMLIVNFVFTTFPAVAHAGLVGTDEFLSTGSRSQHTGEVRDVLARDEVRAQMQALGVDPAGVAARIDALSDAELARLSREIQQLPNGAGVIEVVGVVFIVLLILELVGVTNIFNAF